MTSTQQRFRTFDFILCVRVCVSVTRFDEKQRGLEARKKKRRITMEVAFDVWSRCLNTCVVVVVGVSESDVLTRGDAITTPKRLQMNAFCGAMTCFPSPFVLRHGRGIMLWISHFHACFPWVCRYLYNPIVGKEQETKN